MSSETKKYLDYARECLKLAESADRTDHRERLIELSKVWMEAAMNEQRHHLSGIAGRSSVSSSDFAE
jgi:hypothetical protein